LLQGIKGRTGCVTSQEVQGISEKVLSQSKRRSQTHPPKVLVFCAWRDLGSAALIVSRHVGHPWYLCKPRRLGCTAAMTADQLAFRIVLLFLGLGAWHASARPCSGNNTFHSLFKESDLPTSAPPARCLERWHSSIAGPRTVHAGVTRRHEHSAASGMPEACRHGSYYGLRASEGNAKRLLQFLR
jgi:hypothetical protein